MLLFSPSPINLQKVAAALKQGAVVAMPTETAYGLIADSSNQKAVEKIYAIKGRKPDKPLPLICSSFFQVEKFFYLPSPLRKLAKEFWPGPLSLQLRVKKIKGKKIAVPTWQNTLVVRVSADKTLRYLARKLGWPLTATSANVSGKGELYDSKGVAKQFARRKTKPDIIWQAGKIPQRKPSTIVALQAGKLKVLRKGPIKIKSAK